MKRSLIIASFSLLAFASAAQNLVDSLQKVVNLNRRDTVQVKALNYLAVEFARTDVRQTIKYLYEAKTLVNALHTTLGLSSIYSQLTIAHQNTGSLDSARYYLKKLESISESTRKTKANYHNTAGLFYKDLQNLKQALPHLVKALDYIDDPSTRAGQLLNIGNLYQSMGETRKAADYHLQGLRGFEALKIRRGEAFCLNGLGNDYLLLHQYNTAKKYLEQSIAIKEELNDQRGMITGWGALGEVYMELKEYKSAHLYLNKSIRKANELNLVQFEPKIRHNLGLLFKILGNDDSARFHFSRGLLLAQQASDSLMSSQIRAQLVLLDTDHKKRAQAEQTLLNNVIVAEAAGDQSSSGQAHARAAAWYADQKEFEAAYSHLNQSVEYDKHVRGSDVLLQLNELEEKYLTEKKEREIEVLKKDQALKTAELEKEKAVQVGIIVSLLAVIIIGVLLVNRYQVLSRTRRMTEMEKMRNAIARDLHDDIGSTLSSIHIMSQVAQKDGDAQSSTYFQKIAIHSGRMMENMSDIVWSITPGNDSLDKIVVKMKEFAAEILEPQNISFQFHGEASLHGITLDIEKRKNIFLIFKEAVNNAAKYSGATSLDIRLEKNGNTLSFKICDNGKGFGPEEVKLGNGLRNMKARALALNGNLDLVTDVPRGTTVALTLPLT